MDTKLEAVLNVLRTEEDGEVWMQALNEAMDLAPHHAEVLYYQSMVTEDNYQTLSILDHALRHKRHELIEANAFDVEAIEDFAQDNEGMLYLHLMEARMKTLMDIRYFYQAMADYNEMRYLDSSRLINIDDLGLLIALNMDNPELAKAMYDQVDEPGLNSDFIMAVLLHKYDETDEALTILKPYVVNDPYFRTLVKNIVRSEPLTEETIEYFEYFIPILMDSLEHLRPNLLEVLIEEFH